MTSPAAKSVSSARISADRTDRVGPVGRAQVLVARVLVGGGRLGLTGTLGIGAPPRRGVAPRRPPTQESAFAELGPGEETADVVMVGRLQQQDATAPQALLRGPVPGEE